MVSATEVERSAPGTSTDIASFKVYRATTSWIYLLCGLAAIGNLIFILWSVIILIIEFR